MSARDDYHRERERSRGLLEGIRHELEIHANAFDGAGGRSYGAVGDLQSVNGKLLDIYRFLNGDEHAAPPQPEFSVPQREA